MSRKCFNPSEDNKYFCNGEYSKDGSLYVKCCQCNKCSLQVKLKPQNINKGMYWSR